MEHFIGIEIGGTKLQIVVGQGNGTIVERRKFLIDPASGAAGIRTQIAEALPSLLSARPLSGVGVGFGGPVNTQTGRIEKSHQVEGWSEFGLGEWLGKLTSLPVAVENDANLAALGEALCGAGRGFNPSFYVTLGSGVGGGLVVNGAVYHGSIPGEAEIGHLRLDREGTIVEERCSGWAVDRRIVELQKSSPQSLLSRLSLQAERGQARCLSQALAQQDPAAKNLLREVATDLAFALSHVTHLMHPEVLILGGGLSLVGEPLRQGVAEALPPFLMNVFRPGPQVRLAELQEDAVPVGALCLAGGLARSPTSI